MFRNFYLFGCCDECPKCPKCPDDDDKLELFDNGSDYFVEIEGEAYFLVPEDEYLDGLEGEPEEEPEREPEEEPEREPEGEPSQGFSLLNNKGRKFGLVRRKIGFVRRK